MEHKEIDDYYLTLDLGVVIKFTDDTHTYLSPNMTREIFNELMYVLGKRINEEE